jgi:hypothetical protein
LWGNITTARPVRGISNNYANHTGERQHESSARCLNHGTKLRVIFCQFQRSTRATTACDFPRFGNQSFGRGEDQAYIYDTSCDFLVPPNVIDTSKEHKNYCLKRLRPWKKGLEEKICEGNKEGKRLDSGNCAERKAESFSTISFSLCFTFELSNN